MVLATISKCVDAHANQLNLNNDYTNEQGYTLFKRLFYNNDKQFRVPTKEETHKWMSLLFRNTSDGIQSNGQALHAEEQGIQKLLQDLSER
jgi:hypothetical protein